MKKVKLLVVGLLAVVLIMVFGTIVKTQTASAAVPVDSKKYGFYPTKGDPLSPYPSLPRGQTTSVISVEADKTRANPGDVITYTVTNIQVSARGNGQRFYSYFDTKADYVYGSLVIEGKPMGDALADGDNGSYGGNNGGRVIANIPKMGAIGTKSTFSYKVRVRSGVAKGTKLNVEAYIIDPLNWSVMLRDYSGLTIEVGDGNGGGNSGLKIDTIKVVSKTIAEPGESLIYEVHVKNNNETAVSGIKISDVIDSNLLTYEPGSLSISGVPYTDGVDGDPTAIQGNLITATMPVLQPQKGAFLRFRAKVKATAPNGSKILNQGKVENTISKETVTTNIVTTTVESPASLNLVNAVKTVDKTAAQPGEVVTYSINLKNNNPVVVGGFRVTDALNTNLVDYQAGSTTINGIAYTDAADGDSASYSGGLLTANTPVLAAGGEAVITFKAKIKQTIASGTSIINSALVTDMGTSLGSKNTNQVNTIVSIKPTMEKISAVKSVDKTTAKPGDVLTYTFKVKNNNTVSAGGFRIRDVLDVSLVEYQANSMTLNNKALTDSTTDADEGQYYNNMVNVTTALLRAGEEATVTFKVKVKNVVPNGTIISNQATIFDVGADLGSKATNRVDVTIKSEVKPTLDLISAVKSVDKTVAKPGDVLTYTIKVKNNNPVVAGSFKVRDIIDPSVVDYQANSITLNGKALTDSVADDDEAQFYSNIVNLTTAPLAAGEEATVTFKVKAKDSLPNGTVISNQATIFDLETDLGPKSTNRVDVTVKQEVKPTLDLISAVKSVDKTEAQPGDILTYTIKVKNNNPVTAGKFKVRDILDPTLVDYQANSSTINGKALTDAADSDAGEVANNMLNILTEPLAAGEEATVTFKVKVKTTIANGTVISNQGTVFDMETDLGSKTTNRVNVTVNAIVKPSLNLISTVKSVDKTTAQAGDTLTYTIRVKNNNLVTAGGFTVTDMLDLTKVDYQAGSTTVDGISYTDAQDGDRVSYVNGKVTAGVKEALAPGQEAVIVFKVKIKDNVAANTVVTNKANVLDRTGLGEKQTNQVSTTVEAPAKTTTTIYLKYYLDLLDGRGDVLQKEVPVEVEVGSTFVVSDHIIDMGYAFDFSVPATDFIVQGNGIRQEVNYYYYDENAL